MIVKYLTSSKLTKLQLRDAAFRRTLLVQCLILLHACAHPKHAVNKPPAHQLKEKQVPLCFSQFVMQQVSLIHWFLLSQPSLQLALVFWTSAAASASSIVHILLTSGNCTCQAGLDLAGSGACSTAAAAV